MQTFAWFGHTLIWEESSRLLRIDEQSVQLSQPQATILLALLLQGPQSYGDLRRALYTEDVDIPRTLEKLIERLRKRLQTTALAIYTIRGFGYIALPVTHQVSRRPTRIPARKDFHV